MKAREAGEQNGGLLPQAAGSTGGMQLRAARGKHGESWVAGCCRGAGGQGIRTDDFFCDEGFVHVQPRQGMQCMVQRIAREAGKKKRNTFASGAYSKESISLSMAHGVDGTRGMGGCWPQR
jgi:hypothetical protein